MRIFELLHGRTLREDGTDLNQPAPAIGTTPPASSAPVPTPAAPPSSTPTSPFAFLDQPPPINPQTGRPPMGFGPTLPGYSKDPTGNWTNPQGRPPDQMIKVGQGVTMPGWEIPQSPAEKAAFQQSVHGADQLYQTKGDMSGWNKLLGWDENAAFDTAKSMLNRR